MTDTIPVRRWRVQSAALLLTLALLGAAWWSFEALLIQRTVQEGRTVADMAENIGRWASQYGGVHARTVGTDKFPGNFLTRASFASSSDDQALLNGSRVGQVAQESEALRRIETYYWKNPALVQREVADVIVSSGSLARYRMTARSVMNTNNAPTAFELHALDSLQADPARREYWEIQGGQLLFARAVIAQKSCLRCHTSAESAPDFIRTNTMFNGGGGYGYVEGKPAGLISVTVPLPGAWRVWQQLIEPRVVLALVAAASALLWLLMPARRGPR